MGARSSQSRGPGLNETDGHLLEYFRNTFGVGGGGNSGPTAAPPGFGGPQGLTATGGVVSDYVDGDEVYRAHVFTSSGTFAVTDSTSNFPLSSKVLIVAGGGGGGGGPNWAGGGGAGGLLEATAFTLAQRSYPIVIGSGGYGGLNNSTQGGDGVNTVFTDPGGPTAYTANGGGGGGAGNSPKDGRAGGSGGGSADNDPTFGPSTQSPASPFTGYGNVGGGPGGSNGSSGGGGAGSPSTRSVSDKYPGTRYVTGTTSAPINSPSVIGHRGRPNTFAYGPSNPQVYAGGGGGGYFDWDGPGSTTGAGVLNPTNSITDMNSAPANGGGGGKGGSYYQGVPIAERSGAPGTGGGGGGGIETSPRSPKHPNAPQPAVGGNGGGGTVVVAYQIGRLTAALKATGGAVSFYSNKTIHTFTSSGTFIAPGSFNETVEYVIVAGGGGGATSDVGGAGGAGGYLTGTTPINNTGPGNPTTTTVSVGAGAGAKTVDGPAGDKGNPSSFGTPLTAYGGGGGGGDGTGGQTPTFGGSGGGARYGQNTDQWGLNPSTPAPVIATFPEYTPGTTQGYPGGKQSSGAPVYGSGGGGGAGGAGGAGTNDAAGVGGIGIRIPTTFHNPAVAPGPGTGPQVGGGLGSPGPAGGFYVAGGGGGATEGGSFGLGGYGGGGSGGGPGDSPRPVAQSGVINTGGGGGSDDNGATTPGGGGGSGIVLIAYPT